MMRVVVVVVVVVVVGDYFEVMTLRSRSTFFAQGQATFLPSLFISYPKFSLGLNPSRLIMICRPLTRFFFGVGSVYPD